MYASYDQYVKRQAAGEYGGIYARILYDGKPQIRVDGPGKTVHLEFYDSHRSVTEVEPTTTTLSDYWSFTIRNADGTKYEEDIPALDDIVEIVNDSVYEIKIKLTADNINLLGKKLILHGQSYDGKAEASTELNIVSL